MIKRKDGKSIAEVEYVVSITLSSSKTQNPPIYNMFQSISWVVDPIQYVEVNLTK